MKDFIYHGSKKGGLEKLNPKPHGAVGGEDVVFAATDKVFALAMIYGTGNQLAIDYTDDKMFLDEIEEGALELLDQEGWLYTVPLESFKKDDRLIDQELISYNEVKVMNEEYTPNILARLKEMDVEIVPYDKVPESMEGRDDQDEFVEYDEGRFQSLD